MKSGEWETARMVRRHCNDIHDTVTALHKSRMRMGRPEKESGKETEKERK
jgi:hypothetical protein